MTDSMTVTGDGPFGRLPALPSDGYATHEVMNQATPFTGHNAFTGDRLLGEIARREKIGWADGLLADAGSTVASARVAKLARDANRNLPELKSHDRFGNRIDEIDFHPAWHELMALAIGHGTHALSWTARQPGAHVARGMLSYLWNQGENGICCPLGMTYSAIPALRLQPELAAVWEPFILSTRYDPAAAPLSQTPDYRWPPAYLRPNAFGSPDSCRRGTPKRRALDGRNHPCRHSQCTARCNA